jgi:hypothetical protein
MKLTEKDLSTYIFDLLSTDDWHVFRMEPVSRREWGKGTGELGQPDLLAIRYSPGVEVDCVTNPPTRFFLPLAEVLWCEVKRAGAKAKPHQREWIELERKRGALVLLIGEDVEATTQAFFRWYRDSGLMRKEIR